MRIRRQPQLNSQGTARAENLSDGSLPPPAIVESKPLSPPQNDTEDLHDTIDGLSMIYSTSKFRASVNWLDRLRAAKGFPVDSHSHIEEILSSSRVCCPEDKQCCQDEKDDVSRLKQKSVTTLKGGRNGADELCNRVAKTFLSESLNSNIPNTALPTMAKSCENRSVQAESCPSHSHSQSFDKQQSLPSAENSIAGPNSLSSADLNKMAQSKSPDLRSSLCQDSNTEATLSQLYYNMFADLFCVDSCSLNSLPSEDMKKRQRKQQKPKVCSTFADPDPPCAVATSSQLRTCEFDTQASCPNDSANPTSQSEAAAVVKPDMPSSSPEVEGSEKTLAPQKKKVSVDPDRKKDETEMEQSPMNEILVIDTSLPEWKARKFVAKKGNGWRIRDKVFIAPIKDSNSECTVKELKKRPPTSNMKNRPATPPTTSSTKNELTNVPEPLEPSICREKIQKDAAESGECPSSTEYVARLWSTAPNTHIRSSRKRRKTIVPEEEAPKELPEEAPKEMPETACTEVEPSEKLPDPSFDDPATTQTFASDHPANQPKEGLIYSIYQVFMQAGKSGLTPREAVSRILEQGLPGLHEGGVVPRVEVLKIVSNSPYFMPLEESKYILCSALVGDGYHTAAGEQSTQNREQNDVETDCNSLENAKAAKQHGMSQYWAACAAIRRARTGKTRRKPTLGSYFLNTSTTSHEIHEQIGILSSKKRLKSVKQDVTGLGNPCNRSDGKGWHCPLRAKVGYLLCDHHLDRLRTRVKSHIKSKMLSITKASKDERKRILNGSWMVKKVVERSRIGRASQVPFEVDEQDEFPVNASEVPGSRFS